MSLESNNRRRPKWGAVSFQRRRFPRIDVTLPVEYNVVETEGSDFKPVITHNISSGGLLLILPEFQPMSTCLRLRIFIGVRSIDAEVKVVWTELLTGRESGEFRCGVYFTNITGMDLEYIKQFIAEYMERERQ